MEITFFRSYCLSKNGVTEDTPFGPDTLCFRVGGKIFALVDILAFESVNLKCDPELAVDIRERYTGVTPCYHLNKKHWNTVPFDGSVPDPVILEWIDHSYELVLKSLPKKVQADLSL